MVTIMTIITAMTTIMTTGIITIHILMPITLLVRNRCVIENRPASPVDDGWLWGAI